MSRITIAAFVTFAVLASAGCITRATEPGVLDAAALRAWAGKPWNKAARMHTTAEVGRYRGVPVVAEYPCSDVCPQYTVRIIHYQLPPDVSCASAGGVEKQVLVPIAIAVRSKTFCIPPPLVASDQYYSR